MVEQALAWQSLRAIASEWQIGRFSGVYAAATIIIRMNPFFLDISAYKVSDYDDDGNAGADFGVNIDLNLVFNLDICQIGFSATLMINKIRRPTKWLIDHLTMVMMLKIMKVGRWGEG
ncbi:unnamed protein product, partial [Enterobius vermicularis]|uniref:Uncharacterized protein n=1 Tax=Enterobius vermicularis TaxID=51028 RepID=A0A0N4VHQ5_ENTVE